MFRVNFGGGLRSLWGDQLLGPHHHCSALALDLNLTHVQRQRTCLFSEPVRPAVRAMSDYAQRAALWQLVWFRVNFVAAVTFRFSCITMSNSSIHQILNAPNTAGVAAPDSPRIILLADEIGTSHCQPREHQATSISRHISAPEMLSIPVRSRPLNLIQPGAIGSSQQSRDEGISPPIMETSASPIVHIQPWSNTAVSPAFVEHSRNIHASLNSQGRPSPIDASRLANHPYSKVKSGMSSASSSRRGSYQSSCLSPSDSEMNRPVPPASGGLKHSPRRKRRPDFPSSPRAIAGRDGDDYAMDTHNYTQTPSILRVPYTPIQPAMTPHSPYHHFGPPSARDPYAMPGSALPTSSVRDCPPDVEGSVRSARYAPRANALPRSRHRTESIPRSYVLKSLNNLAPHFWNRPGTADCRISKADSLTFSALSDASSTVIPIKNPGQLTPSPSTLAILNSPTTADSPRFRQAPPSSSDATARYSPPPSAAGTFGASSPQMLQHQGVAPAEANQGPKVSLPFNQHDELLLKASKQILSFMLHRDYLVTQSTLFQRLLDPSPEMPADQIKAPVTAPSTHSSFAERKDLGTDGGNSQGPGKTPPLRACPNRINGAKVLTTSTGNMTSVWLPLPDPNSFAVLAHWLYW